MTCPSVNCALSWIEAHSGLAAWVQGAGTLIALFLTVWAVLHEAGRADRARREDLRNWVETVEDLTHDLTMLVAGHRNEARVPSTATRGEVDEFRMMLGKLLETPLMQWPSSRLRARVWRLSQDLQEMVRYAKQWTTVAARRANDTQQARRAVEYISLQSALATTADLILSETAKIRRDASIVGRPRLPEGGAFRDQLWRYSVNAPDD